MTELMTIDRTTENQEQFMTDLIESKGNNLPAKIEDVLQVFEFTEFKAKAWKIMSERLNKLEDQSDAYHSALRSGQHWGIAALYSQMRMGDITKEMPTAPGHRNLCSDETEVKYKTQLLKEAGITNQTKYVAETFSNNSIVLDRVIESVVGKGDIPTKTAVLNTIKAEQSKERNEAAKKKSDDKLDNQKSQSVSDYFEVIKGFKAGISFAMIAAERGKFAPEGKNFLIKKHNEIRKMLIKLEGLI